MTGGEARSRITTKYRTAGGTRPDLGVVETPDGKAVIKDFRHSDLLFRLIVGPILIGRECKALSRLQGIDGIPHLIKRLDRYSFLMEHIEGTSLDSAAPEDIPEGFFDRAKRVVDETHLRGVAHCDLRSRGNLMVGKDGQPYVVDFAACVLKGRGLNPFINWLFNQFMLADNHAVLMAKKRLAPQYMTTDEEQVLATPLPYEERAKALGQWFRRTTRKLLTKKS